MYWKGLKKGLTSDFRIPAYTLVLCQMSCFAFCNPSLSLYLSRWMSWGCECESWRRGRGRRARSWRMKMPSGRSEWQRRPLSICRRNSRPLNRYAHFDLLNISEQVTVKATLSMAENVCTASLYTCAWTRRRTQQPLHHSLFPSCL